MKRAVRPRGDDETPPPRAPPESRSGLRSGSEHLDRGDIAHPALRRAGGTAGTLRTAGAEGTVVFASTYLDQDLARWSDYPGTEAAPGPFFEASATPSMPWKP